MREGGNEWDEMRWIGRDVLAMLTIKTMSDMVAGASLVHGHATQQRVA
jgi:hypothetical protein